VRVPIGIIGVIYEARPNVTADAGALCIKSGNVVVLRGGSDSFHSSRAIVELLRRALKDAGLPEDCVQLVPTTDRAAVGEMLKAMDWLDLIVPRGGRSLIDRVTAESRVPVLRHYDGICHVYVDRDADVAMARDVVANAKMRPGQRLRRRRDLLIDRAALDTHLMPVLARLHELGCEVRGDAEVRKRDPRRVAASEKDWRTEYLEPIISVATVDGVEGAIRHIATYGSQHTESIVTANAATAERFLREVDSAIVMHNASTQFADGGEFGWARRSASRPTACMPAARSGWSSSRPTRTSCAARARCGLDLGRTIRCRACRAIRAAASACSAARSTPRMTATGMSAWRR
jgi:glutamate-5-semialdehyde dehydrogenase